MSLYPRLDNVDGDNHVPSPHFVEQFFLNLRNTLPQELQAFIEQTKIIVQRELREAADANRELNRWGLTKSIFKAFRETGSALFLLAYLYPTLCRTNENIIDGIIGKYSPWSWIGGYTSTFLFPQILEKEYFKKLLIQVTGADVQSKTLFQRLLAAAIRSSFNFGIFAILPPLLPVLKVGMPEIGVVDVPQVGLQLVQLAAGVQQGIISYGRMAAVHDRPDQDNSADNPLAWVPIDMSDPDVRQQIQMLLPVYISEQSIKTLWWAVPLGWKLLRKVSGVHYHFYWVRRWHTAGFKGSMVFYGLEAVTIAKFSSKLLPKQK